MGSQRKTPAARQAVPHLIGSLYLSWGTAHGEQDMHAGFRNASVQVTSSGWLSHILLRYFMVLPEHIS